MANISPLSPQPQSMEAIILLSASWKFFKQRLVTSFEIYQTEGIGE